MHQSPDSPARTPRPRRFCLAVPICIGMTMAGGLAGPVALAPPAEGVALNGKTAYAAPAKALALDPKAITVSAWVKVRNAERAQIFLNRGRANNAFTLYLYKRNVRMLVGHLPKKYAFALAPPPKADTWTHYAGSYDGQTLKVYRNGRLEAQTQAPGRMQTRAGDLYIGALDETERFLTGRIDDVCVWQRVLSDEEIASMAGGKRPDGLGEKLLARWTASGLAGETWTSQPPQSLPATLRKMGSHLMNKTDNGYRGIWYYNQPSKDEYVYKYSGGLGTYCAKHIPHAWYVKEAHKTFFCYGGSAEDENRLLHMVSFYDHATGRVPRPTILMDKKTDDAHDNPVLCVDPKGFLWIFSSSHGTGRPSYISRSTKPHAIDEFECVWTGNYSYPQPCYIPQRGFLLPHTHYTKGRSLYLMTSPDGRTWSDRRLLARIQQGHYQITRPCGPKVGTAFNYHPAGKGVNWRTNLYYMQTEDVGKTWKNIRSQALEIPLTQPANAALVHDYAAEKLNVYLKDITYDAAGNPVILYVTSKGYESGPQNMPRTWTTARWTGAAWDIQGSIVSDNNYDTGSLYVESEDLWRIIGPTQVGPQPFNPGGEVAMWTSADRGRTWKMARQMTKGSEYNHTYVRRQRPPGFLRLLGRRARAETVRLASLLLQPPRRRLPPAGGDEEGLRETPARAGRLTARADGSRKP